MMRIVDFIHEDLIIPELRARGKLEVLSELAERIAARQAGLGSEQVLKVLADRERLASTAIGEGVAIPHGKLNAVPSLIGCVGRAVGGVEFDSMDGRPTQIFFVLVAPESSTGVHLKALARISRLFKDPGFRVRLLGAEGAEAMYQVIRDEDAKH